MEQLVDNMGRRLSLALGNSRIDQQNSSTGLKGDPTPPKRTGIMPMPACIAGRSDAGLSESGDAAPTEPP